MLCPSVFQARPLTDGLWPVRSLWPETRPLFYHLEQEMLRHVQEMRQSMEFMERLHQKIFEEIDRTPATATFGPIAFHRLSSEGGGLALSLDTQEFAPEELSVKQVGRKLRVSGKTEKKQEDGKGSYSYRCQEFRQELDLPDDVEPETVRCSLVGGRLQIQAPREKAAGDGKERLVPIAVASAVDVPVQVEAQSSQSEGPSSTDKVTE
ncbi:heat shock protein beta 9-like [Stigmatopora argus]